MLDQKDDYTLGDSSPRTNFRYEQLFLIKFPFANSILYQYRYHNMTSLALNPRWGKMSEKGSKSRL